LHIITAQSSCVGTWENIDDEDGKPKSHIEIYEEDGKLYGKVIKLLENATIRNCIKCEGDRKDQALEGMVILWDLKIKKNKGDKGKIIDPKTGKIYDCKIELDDENTLKVRGYIKTPFLGRTQKWYRVTS
jgi:uncharacterized protein (DUF2147 family)